MMANTTAPMPAQISCMVTNWESAWRTLPAHEKASLLGGSYHQLITAGPNKLEPANPTTAPPASTDRIHRVEELPAASSVMAPSLRPPSARVEGARASLQGA